MSSIGQRGKWAEGKVSKFLDEQERMADCAAHRFPDARSGSMKVVPSDFMYMKAGKLTMIEVKEVEHDFRLPYANFKSDKVSRMRIWQLAGAEAVIVICHRTTGLWRVVDLSNFLSREAGSGSWDLSRYATFDQVSAFNLMINWHGRT